MKPCLDDLLSQWQESPDRSPEDICQEHPELLPDLRDRIAILIQIERLAAGVAVPFSSVLPSRLIGKIPRDN